MYIAVHYCTLLYITVHYCTLMYITVQYPIHYCTVYCTLMYITVCGLIFTEDKWKDCMVFGRTFRLLQVMPGWRYPSLRTWPWFFPSSFSCPLSAASNFWLRFPWWPMRCCVCAWSLSSFTSFSTSNRPPQCRSSADGTGCRCFSAQQSTPLKVCLRVPLHTRNSIVVIRKINSDNRFLPS